MTVIREARVVREVLLVVPLVLMVDLLQEWGNMKVEEGVVEVMEG
jgi:hypothetical protein